MPAYSTHYCLPAAYCVLRTAAYCAYCAYCAYYLLCGDCLTCLLRTAHRSPPTTPRGAGAHEAARGEESRARGLRRPGQRRQETGARSLRSGMKEARIKPYRLAPHRACAHVPYHPGPGWRWGLGSWGQTVGRCAKQRVGGVGWSQSAHKEGRGQRVHIFHGARCPPRTLKLCGSSDHTAARGAGARGPAGRGRRVLRPHTWHTATPRDTGYQGLFQRPRYPPI